MVFAVNKQLSKCQLPNSLCDKNAPNVVASASLQSNGAREVGKRKKRTIEMNIFIIREYFRIASTPSFLLLFKI
jgi:hypothetical protein